jgi:hypothetical protein
MRLIVISAILAATVALGGCGCFFHHSQQVAVSELPPPVDTTPIK